METKNARRISVMPRGRLDAIGAGNFWHVPGFTAAHPHGFGDGDYDWKWQPRWYANYCTELKRRGWQPPLPRNPMDYIPF